MKVRKTSLILAAVLFMSTSVSFSGIQRSFAETSETGDRIVRVATTGGFYAGTRDENVQNIYSAIDDAAKSNPDFIVLSEGSYSIQSSLPSFETVPGPFTDLLAAKAIQCNTYIAANMYEDGQDGHKYNTEVLINKQGQVAGKYHKVRLPISETTGNFGMTEGTGPAVFDTEFGKIGLEICYDIDIRFPEVTKATADAGAEIILVSSMGDYNHAAVQFARQSNVFMVTSIRDEIWTDPYPVSGIIANDGTIINGIDKPGTSGPKSCYADINLTKKTWSVPEPTKYSGVTPPPARTAIPFADITASDTSPGKDVQSLADGSIDNIDAGPDKGHKYWSSATKQPTITFDMGSVKQLGSVGVVQFDTFYNQDDYFKMYFSQDGVNYVECTKGYKYGTKSIKDYDTGSTIGVKCFAADFAPGYKYVEVNPPLDVRYIKIVGYGNNTSDYKPTNLTEVTAFKPLNPDVTSAPFPTSSPAPTPTPTKTPVPTPTLKPSATPTPTATPTATPTLTLTVAPTATLTPTTAPTDTPTITPTTTQTPEPTIAYLFTDIPDNHWAKDQIYSLAARGIIAGYDNGDGTYSYNPDVNIKRSEFIKILTCAFGVYDAESVYDGFTDVNKADWYYSYVASAVKEGLTLGVSADKFGSDQEITRQDLITFIQRALVKYKGYDAPSDEQINSSLAIFADRDQVQDYARPALALLVENDVIRGYIEGDKTYFKPENNATRAEVAIIADKSIKLENLLP